MENQNGDSTPAAAYPVVINVAPALEGRDRLTVLFRFFLAIPHILLVGGPMAVGCSVGWNMERGVDWQMGSSGGLLGAVAALTTVLAWFAILVTARYPDTFWRLAAFYLRWRVRVIAYVMLLRDEYPPFGDEAYPAELTLPEPESARDRLTVFFRYLLALPHLILLGLLSLVWALTTAIAWFVILVTGRYPETLYGFAIGMLAWEMRVNAYVLLMRDEYPPFTLRT